MYIIRRVSPVNSRDLTQLQASCQVADLQLSHKELAFYKKHSYNECAPSVLRIVSNW